MHGLYSHGVRTGWDYQPSVCRPSACLPTCLPADIPWISTHLWHFQDQTLWGEGFCRRSQSLGHGAWHLRSFRYPPLFRCFHFQEQKAPTPPPLCPLKRAPLWGLQQKCMRDIISDSHRFQQSVTGFYSRKSNILWQISHLPSSLNDIAREWHYQWALFPLCSWLRETFSR